MEKLSKLCFSTLIAVSLLANYITSTVPSELPFSQPPETPYESLSPDYFSYAPEIEAPAPEIGFSDVVFSPESAIDNYLIPPEYPSPPPPPPFTDPLPEIEAPAPASAPSAALPLPYAAVEDGDDEVAAEDSTGEDEVVVEYDQEEEGSSSGGKISGGAVVGVIFGVCVVGLAGFMFKKKKDSNLRRSQPHQYLDGSKKEEGYALVPIRLST